MRKKKLYLLIALTLAILASVVFNQANGASAQGLDPVGVVVAYTPGQSITIADQAGAQHQYMISPSVKILPPPRANQLKVGSFVTIIAPASLGNGKQTAVGIVVHPQVPPGWKMQSSSATPLPTDSAAATATVTPTGTLLVTDTATATATPTGFVSGTATDTPTAFGTVTETSTPTATPTGGGTAINANSLIDLIRSLLRQLLGSTK